jgi:limonene-1,2-epoxide hydrolase
MEPGAITRASVHRWIDAVGSGDVEAVLATLDPGCVYQNVPEDPVVGHDAIRALFARVLSRSDRVRFDVVSEAYDGTTGWVERVDRFWIDGTEHTVACNGVFTVDSASGLITRVRDYLDLTGWRQRMVGTGL